MQLTNAKEYDEALELLNNIGKSLTKRVGEHFLPAEKEDAEKVLQDNHYSFNFRKLVAQHHLHFYDYKGAEK